MTGARLPAVLIVVSAMRQLGRRLGGIEPHVRAVGDVSGENTDDKAVPLRTGSEGV
jgi:hypothetical protein